MRDPIRFGAGFFASLLALGLGWSCTAGWQPGDRQMTYELVGLHATLPCQSCHPAEQPLGTLPEECAACHEADRPLDHFDGDCGVCHTPFGWDDVVIVHDFFPLTGAHDLDCLACHEPDTYEGLDPSCASCHEPDRPQGHFEGQDCSECHRPTTWEDADFDHDQAFPLPHEGVDECTSCHLGGDTSQFSCIDCHEHNRADMDDEHEDEGGYQWKSQACLSCHPKGKD